MSNDIVSVMKHLYQTIMSKVEEENKRYNDPNWQLVNVHIASPDIADLMTSPDTPIDIKRGLLIGTFIGQQWIHNTERQTYVELTDGVLVVEDAPIIDWGYNTE